MWKWAMHKIRDVYQFMSIPFLPAGERFRANGALPAILRGSNEWCDDALDRGGRRAQVRLRLGVDKTLNVGPLLDRLPGLRQNE